VDENSGVSRLIGCLGLQILVFGVVGGDLFFLGGKSHIAIDPLEIPVVDPSPHVNPHIAVLAAKGVRLEFGGVSIGGLVKILEALG
jgi:hypothetical protein